MASGPDGICGLRSVTPTTSAMRQASRRTSVASSIIIRCVCLCRGLLAALRNYPTARETPRASYRRASHAGSQMSLDTAEKLFRQVQQPTLGSVAKKQPRVHHSMRWRRLFFASEMIRLPIRYRKTRRPDYLDSIFEAAAVFNLYVAPFPGSTMFVMPGPHFRWRSRWLSRSPRRFRSDQ